MGLTSWAFQDMCNGTYFVELSGYAQWNIVRGPFGIYAMGLLSWAFQDMPNGTSLEGLSGYSK
jgi:hypothetical protein